MVPVGITDAAFEADNAVILRHKWQENVPFTLTDTNTCG
jgi:hypothetical protein